MQRFLLLIVVCFALLLSAGCRRRADIFRSPYPQEALEAGELAVHNETELLAALSSRTRFHDELWVRSQVSVRRDSERGRDHFTALVLYQAPDKVRLRGSRSPIGNIFDALIVGDRAWLYFNREGRRFDGTLEELAEKSGAIGGLSPRELVSAIFVLQELNAWLQSEARLATFDRGSHLLVAARHPHNRLQLFWLVRKQDALVEEVLIRTPEGREILRLKYDEYTLELNPRTEVYEVFPRRFMLRIPLEGVQVELDAKEYKLHPGLPPAAFLPPPARYVHPLRDLAFEDHEH